MSPWLNILLTYFYVKKDVIGMTMNPKNIPIMNPTFSGISQVWLIYNFNTTIVIMNPISIMIRYTIYYQRYSVRARSTCSHILAKEGSREYSPNPPSTAVKLEKMLSI